MSCTSKREAGGHRHFGPSVDRERLWKPQKLDGPFSLPFFFWHLDSIPTLWLAMWLFLNVETLRPPHVIFVFNLIFCVELTRWFAEKSGWSLVDKSYSLIRLRKSVLTSDSGFDTRQGSSTRVALHWMRFEHAFSRKEARTLRERLRFFSGLSRRFSGL